MTIKNKQLSTFPILNANAYLSPVFFIPLRPYFLYLIFTVFFSFFTVKFVVAQDKQPATDTVYHYEDRTLYKQHLFYQKWKKKTAKYKCTKELFNILFDSPTATTPRFFAEQSNAQTLASYEGMIIAKINFKIIRPFGQRVNQLPTDSTDNKLESWGNKIHMTTKEGHLRRLLSFSEGSCLDIMQLEDNEEMLRSLEYVDELYITITPLSAKTIALNFLIKDRFPWSLSYQVHDLNAHKIKLSNKNLWGRGHAARVQYFYNPEKRVIHSVGIEYKVPSIGKSRIRSTSILEHSNSHDKYSLELSRPFIDYKTRYAGGLTLSLIKNAESVPTNMIAHFPNSINYHEVDAWGGLKTPYDLKKNDKYARYRKALTGRIYHIHFTKHPDIQTDSNLFLLNVTGILLGYNVSKKQLYRSNLMYNYGKVENIPYGHLAQIFAGALFNQWQRKGYIGFNFEKAYYNQEHDNYFSLRLCGGSFFNKREFLDGLLSAEGRYISRLYRFKEIQHRHFFKLRYLLGFNPTDDFLNLNGSNGLRNFSSQYAQGDRKIVLNVEDVFFTPYTLAGFRSAIYSFADLGYISRNSSLFHKKGNFYAGIGLGMRLHNNNFVFKTFQISFALFFKPPKDMNFFKPDASSVKTGRFNNFQIDKPLFYFERENLKR